MNYLKPMHVKLTCNIILHHKWVHGVLQIIHGLLCLWRSLKATGLIDTYTKMCLVCGRKTGSYFDSPEPQCLPAHTCKSLPNPSVIEESQAIQTEKTLALPDNAKAFPPLSACCIFSLDIETAHKASCTLSFCSVPLHDSSPGSRKAALKKEAECYGM